MRTVKAVGFCRRGLFKIGFVHDGRRVVIETTAGLWQARRRRERELDISKPRPRGPSKVARLAVDMVNARLAGTTLTLAADIAPADIAAALKLVGLIDTGIEPGVRLAETIAERVLREVDKP
jgi:hypothetical protein